MLRPFFAQEPFLLSCPVLVEHVHANNKTDGDIAISGFDILLTKTPRNNAHAAAIHPNTTNRNITHKELRILVSLNDAGRRCLGLKSTNVPLNLCHLKIIWAQDQTVVGQPLSSNHRLDISPPPLPTPLPLLLLHPAQILLSPSFHSLALPSIPSLTLGHRIPCTYLTAPSSSLFHPSFHRSVHGAFSSLYGLIPSLNPPL